MQVTQISIGRFHHFHLARQLQKKGLLDSIYTGYPEFKTRDEQGIPKHKIRNFPWFQTPYMAAARFGFGGFRKLERQLSWLACESLDQYVASTINHRTTLVALSGSGLRAGRIAQRAGGKYICDRGSSHIRFQDEILREEYKRWGLTFRGVDPRMMAKEEMEYEIADRVTVPSEFVKDSFLRMGVPAHKLVKVPYGARLERFTKVADAPADRFRVLWVGGVSIRKGFLYLLEAFNKLKHSGKELLVVGAIQPEIRALLPSYNLQNVSFVGLVPNADLPRIYSSAHAFVLPSLEEGLAMVQGEALACGCPVIATHNTGCRDLFTDRKEGFIVPVRSSAAIADTLQELADNSHLQQEMSAAATNTVRQIGGWDTYGTTFTRMLSEL